jgi:hypothetical protein
LISSFIAADQQYRTTPRVKGKEDPIRSSRMPNPKLLHVGMTGKMNKISVRTGKIRANSLKQDHLGVNLDLFGLGQTISPRGKFFRKFNL